MDAIAADTQSSLPSLTGFWDAVGGNQVWYVAGDVLDDGCWARLQGRKFNFIFSDALHRPERAHVRVAND